MALLRLLAFFFLGQWERVRRYCWSVSRIGEAHSVARALLKTRLLGDTTEMELVSLFLAVGLENGRRLLASARAEGVPWQNRCLGIEGVHSRRGVQPASGGNN